MVDSGFYLWKTGGNNWRFRASAGGGFSNWAGNLTPDAAFASMTGYSIEGHDTFNTGGGMLNFNLRIWGESEDGADFSLQSGTSACLNLTLPPGTQVVVGAANTLITTPFDLNTLGACTP